MRLDAFLTAAGALASREVEPRYLSGSRYGSGSAALGRLQAQLAPVGAQQKPTAGAAVNEAGKACESVRASLGNAAPRG